MMSFHGCLVLCALLFNSAFAANPLQIANDPSLQQSDSNNEMATLNATRLSSYGLSCDPTGEGRHRPLWTDCYTAIRYLPTYPTDQRTFHNVGQDVQTRLPVERTHKTCLVTVSLWDGIQDDCTWPAVVDAANELNNECKKRGSIFHGAKQKTGGKVYTGSQRHIIIHLYRAHGSTAFETNNQTAVKGGWETGVTETA